MWKRAATKRVDVARKLHRDHHSAASNGTGRRVHDLLGGRGVPSPIPERRKGAGPCAASSAILGRSAGGEAGRRRAEAARIPRLRFGRRRHPRERAAGAPPRRGQASQPGAEALAGAALRRHRHRPHALGDARAPERDQRPPARDRQAGRRPQRHHREFPRAEDRAPGQGRRRSRPRPTPRSWPSSSPGDAPGRARRSRPWRASCRASRRLRARLPVRRPGGSPDRRAPRRAAGGRLRRRRDVPRLRRARAGALHRRGHATWRTATGPCCRAPGSTSATRTAGRSSGRARRVPAGAFMVDKGNYRHFMAKEIHEQPEVVGRTLAHYVDFTSGRVELPDELPLRLRRSRSRLDISACGTAYYAGLVAKYWFERLARLPVEIDIASEFRYREAPLEPGGAGALRLPVGRDRRHARLAPLRQGAGPARPLGRQRRRPRPSRARAAR